MRITVIATGFNTRAGAQPEMDAARVTPFKRTSISPTPPTPSEGGSGLGMGLDIPEFLQRRRPNNR